MAFAGTPGIDISSWQRDVDFKQVALAGYKFVYVKTSEGLTYKSPTLNVQWNEAGEAGLARGGYHFFHPLKDPKRQAEIVVDIVDRLGVGELPIALDFEGYDGISGVKGNAIVDPAIECMYELERLTGTIPVLYTGPSFWKYRLLPADHEDELKIYPLWEASYGDAPRDMPWPKTIWGTHWTFWQRTGSGTVPGVNGNCDINLFAGNEAQLRALLTGGTLLAGGAE